MNREIKFRAWDGKKMLYNVAVNGSTAFYIPSGLRCHCAVNIEDYLEIMQYTGFKDKNEKSIYEGDILRDEDDLICIAIYIKEWGMFAAVTVDEYKAYQAIGIPALDEEFIWTFPIENGAFKITGNIYENPKILE
ncbi:YopX family protein [Riemerella anatipestifer]|nr:YopX family protein [Riemerella anatipestifer]